MPKEVITLPNTATLPYSPGAKAGNFIFVSGQVGSVDAEGKEVTGIAGQTRECLERVKRVLAAGSASLDDVVKVTVFLRNETDVAAMNDTYRTYFTTAKPARSTVVTGLPRPDMLIEVECIAHV